MSLRKTVKRLCTLVLALPEKVGWVEKETGRKAFFLALPIMIIGGMRILMRLADFFMVSYAYRTDAAVAGMTIGFQYYFIGFGLALALSSGTISLVARSIGAGDHSSANFSIKQSMYLGVLLALPLTLTAWWYTTPLIALLTDDPDVVKLGAVYLRVVMLSLTLRFWNLIFARALAGAGNTETPMWIRMVSVPANVILNGLLIFGPGPFPALGVAGAALGTVLADVIAFGLFLYVLVSGSAGVQLTLTGKQWDGSVVRELVRVSLPLGGMRLSMALGRFPFMFIVAAAGTSLLASFGIARRVMLLALMPAWGFATSASTLVGQNIGAEQTDRAEFSGWQTLRIAIATQLLIGFVLTAAAGPISSLFHSRIPIHTKSFIQVFGAGVAAYSVSRTMQGALRGAGDTIWPFYGTLIGTIIRVVLAAMSLPADLVVLRIGSVAITPGLGYGIEFIYLAILADMYLRALINTLRFASGVWKHDSTKEPPAEVRSRSEQVPRSG